MKHGKFYSVGVGPGDPKLLTYKAVETIKSVQVIAVPVSGGKEQIALNIVKEYLGEKKILYCEMPMVKDQALLATYHQKAAEQIIAYLQQGDDVAFLTLGDASIYATSWYIQKLLVEDFATEIIPGVPSFCAVAAALNTALCEGKEQLHIIPASYDVEQAMELPGTKIFMKAGKSLGKVQALVQKNGFHAQLVERCGLESEKIHYNLTEITDEASYFSVMVVKGAKI